MKYKLTLSKLSIIKTLQLMIKKLSYLSGSSILTENSLNEI
jgi:hypothetical protein